MASAHPGTSVLELRGVSMDFGGLRAVEACSFRVEEGQIYSLIGPNGAGKSTVFNLISGLYRPTGGEISFGGRRITGLRASRIAKLGIARSFQNLELFRGLTAVENVLVGSHRHLGYGVLGALCGSPGVWGKERSARAEGLRLLEFLGIAEHADVEIADLPYGVQKKVEVARALASRPRILLLDEPAAGLNDAETADLMGIVRRIRAERRITVLLVEHNMKLVMGISDRVCALSFGTVLAEGTPQEIQTHPDVIAAYLGEAAC